MSRDSVTDRYQFWRVRLPLILAIPLIAGLVMGWNGGRGGTAYFSKPVSLIYWVTFFLWLWGLMAIGTAVMQRVLAPWHLQGPICNFIGGFVGSLLWQPVYSVYQRFFYDRFLPPNTEAFYWPALPAQWSDAGEFLYDSLFPALLWMASNWILAGLFGHSQALVPSEAANAVRKTPTATSVPPRNNEIPRVAKMALIADANEIVLISARDHYLFLDTPRGEKKILYRFRDAVEDLKRIPGQQIHRSHWVRLDAISEFEEAGLRVRGRFADGKWVEVQKKYAPILSAALALQNEQTAAKALTA